MRYQLTPYINLTQWWLKIAAIKKDPL